MRLAIRDTLFSVVMFVSALSFVGCGSQNSVVNLGSTVTNPWPDSVSLFLENFKRATIPSVDEEEHPVEAKGFNKRDDLFLRRMLTHCDIIPLDDGVVAAAVIVHTVSSSLIMRSLEILSEVFRSKNYSFQASIMRRRFLRCWK